MLVVETAVNAHAWLVAMLAGIGGHRRDMLLAPPEVPRPDVLRVLRDRSTVTNVDSKWRKCAPSPMSAREITEVFENWVHFRYRRQSTAE